MNTTNTVQPSTATARSSSLPSSAVAPTPARHTHRERDFGVGYGNSSGYASRRQYASQWAPSHFKFA